MAVAEIERLERILEKYEGERGALVDVLLDSQQEYNWLPPEVLRRIAQRLGVPASQVHRVASFYKAFSLEPRGRHVVNVCLGTSCHVRGSPRVLDKVAELLRVKPGGTTPDQRFTLKTVNCLGCCALGPVIAVDEEYHGNLPAAKVQEVLAAYG